MIATLFCRRGITVSVSLHAAPGPFSRHLSTDRVRRCPTGLACGEAIGRSHGMSKTIEERLQALEDREELIKLKARYVNYNDGGWQGPTHTNADAVADMFVEDGVWDGSPDAGYAKGRAEIKALFQQFRAVKFIVHYVTNPLIEVDGD